MPGAENSQWELERRVFHLKTLYEVSQVIGSLRDVQQIMKNVLMMVIGTFGAIRGITFLADICKGQLEAVTQRGMARTWLATLTQAVEARYLTKIEGIIDIERLNEDENIEHVRKPCFDLLVSSQLQIWVPFVVNENFMGGIGLGAKLSGEPYTADDQELLSTLANQLTIALDNTLAYIEISQLNVGLEAKVQDRTAELRHQQERLKQLNRQLETRNRFIREIFGRYVSDEVVASLLESPERLQLGGEKRQVTILMSDLRGFTPLAEHLAPEQVVTIVNRYLGTMVDIIMQYHGTINAFIGDAILVIFGAPIWQEDHAQRAAACAVAMQLAIDSVNIENRRAGLPEVEMGIGINTGEVVAGNIGSQRRTQYTVMGSHVNLASRIESYTVGGQILISETTRQAVGSLLQVAQAMEVTAKGVDRPIILYDVRGIGGEYDLFLPEREETLVSLHRAVPIRYAILEGKHLGEAMFTGRFVKLSPKGGEVYADNAIDPWSDIRVKLLDFDGETILGDLYAKVLGHLPGHRPGFVVRFTYVPPHLLTFLQELLALGSSALNRAEVRL